jgi:phosphoglycerate kinase
MSGLDGISSIEDFDLKNKKVFIRLDLNVPLKDKVITDDTRIRAALPTIEYALKNQAHIILCSHLGRPEKPEDRKKLSLEPVAKRLSDLLKVDVHLVEDPASDTPRALLPTLRENQIVLLENIRFDPGEEKNSVELANRLASYTDIYINDAFGASHRAHASIVALPALIKKKGLGYLMKREIEMLDRILLEPERPFVSILGGAKVSDKIGLIENLMEQIDTFLIGGAMAYTFLAAQKISVGKSRTEKDRINLAQELLGRFEARGKRILLPIDHVIARELKPGAENKITTGPSIEEGWMGLDIGPKTVELFKKEIQNAKTIFWNGPMGVFETPPFEKGTFAVAQALARSEGTTIVGGGDSVSAVNQSGLASKMSHISTGGGASLEYLQGDKLPGLEALRPSTRKLVNTSTVT